MSDTPAPLSDDDLRETLDLLATAVASISDRVDDHTRVLDRVNKTATEARSAAFAAGTPRRCLDRRATDKLTSKYCSGLSAEERSPKRKAPPQ